MYTSPLRFWDRMDPWPNRYHGEPDLHEWFSTSKGAGGHDHSYDGGDGDDGGDAGRRLWELLGF